MGFNNSKVLALINAIKAQILGDVEDKIENHDVVANSSRTGHVQAGGSPQDINLSGTSSPGTDNGYYARADHVHTVNYNNVSGTPTIADNLLTNDATQVLSAKQGKVLNDMIGDAISYINQ